MTSDIERCVPPQCPHLMGVALPSFIPILAKDLRPRLGNVNGQRLSNAFSVPYSTGLGREDLLLRRLDSARGGTTVWDDWEVAERGKRTVYGRVGIWLGSNRHIHLGSGPGQISTISPDPTSARGNPHLYQKLAEIPRHHGRWPQNGSG